MAEDNEKEKTVINLYFKDSSDSDIFDQISSEMNVPSAMMMSVVGGVCSSPSVSDKPFPESKDDVCTREIENVPSKQVCSTESEDHKLDEPVICRIFASQDETKANKTSDKIFFDMIGSVSQTRSETDIMNEPVLSKTLNLPDFGNGEFIHGQLTTISSLDNDVISDELFIKGASPQLIGNKGSSTEIDRRRDAWIPSARTRQALIAMATSPAGSYIPDRDFLTMPGVVLQEDMVDSIYQVVNHYLGEEEALQRKVLTLNDVTQDERGLRQLIQAECYRAAVNLTSRLLTMYGQGVGRAGYSSKHTLHSVQLWFTRIALLVKLRSWSVAWAESEAWWDLDRPDLYFQFYSELYGGRPGTLAPFPFRLLLAELPQYVHRSEEALQRLFSVLSTVRKIVENLKSGLSEDGSHIELCEEDRAESIKLWLSRDARVLHSIINTAFQQKDYKLTVDVLRKLIDHPCYEGNVSQRRTLISSLGRVFLELGDVGVARHYFDQSRSLKSSNNVTNTADLRELIDFGLLSIAEDDFEKGFQYFDEACKKDPLNVMVTNNKAVCLLFQGKQKEAVKLLENVIYANPNLSLYESLLLNVCTLYELESSSSLENKYKMLKLVSKYKGDSMSLNCLKLQVRD